MKHFRIFLFIFLISILSISVFAEVEIKQYVNDYANIITDKEEAELNSILENLHKSNTLEYAIVTVNDLQGKDIESYSLNLAQAVLGDKEKNNGLLLLVALEEKRYRFEVGRGIEYIFNDAKIGRIGRNYLVPNFQNNEYGKGILEATYAINSIMLGDIDSQYYVSDVQEQDFEKLKLYIWLLFFTIIFLVNFFVILSKKKGKDKYFDAAIGAIILFGGRGRGGFGGSGGFGGGFGGFGGGGFGGGGFGGGGASGGW